MRGMFYSCCCLIFMLFFYFRGHFKGRKIYKLYSWLNKTLDQCVKDVSCPSMVIFIFIKSNGQHWSESRVDFLHHSLRGTTAQNTSESEPLLMSFQKHKKWQTVQNNCTLFISSLTTRVWQQYNTNSLPLQENGGDGIQRYSSNLLSSNWRTFSVQCLNKKSAVNCPDGPQLRNRWCGFL